MGMCRLVLALLLVAAANAGSAQVFSEGQQAAAIAFMAHRHQVQTTLQACAERFEDKGGPMFRFSEYFWQAEQQPLALAADKVWAGLAEAKKQAAGAAQAKAARVHGDGFAKAGPRNQFQSCDDALKKGRSGQLRFEAAAPADAALLSALFGSAESLRVARRNTDFTIGCVKRVFNGGGRDLARARATCECQTRAMVAAASDRELDDWVAEMAGHGGKAVASALDKAWFKKAGPALSACPQ